MTPIELSSTNRTFTILKMYNFMRISIFEIFNFPPKFQSYGHNVFLFPVIRITGNLQ